MTLLQAVRTNLLLPGETLAQLRDQWAKLTEKDKADFVEWFAVIGIDATANPPKS